jgi:polyphosphate kinase 2 (PPK2 family)
MPPDEQETENHTDRPVRAPVPPSKPGEVHARDPEVQAIHEILNALQPLDAAGKGHVIDYILVRLGRQIGGSGSSGAPSGSMPSLPVPIAPDRTPTAGLPHTDIKSLREEKQPTSFNEMAALVAFYLKEIATGDEHSETVNTSHIEKYFRQAGYRLPDRAIMALVNARQAGYLDPTGEAGVYKLNPVGYNLVAHSMPTSRRTQSSAIRRPKKVAKGAR